MLWKGMDEFKIPTKFINMCKTCVQKTRSAVRIDGTLSSFFENKAGLKQGDSVSPILFNLALQKVIESIQMVPSGIEIGKGTYYNCPSYNKMTKIMFLLKFL
jgi:hypothetical protein